MLEERREQTFADRFGAIGPVARGKWAEGVLTAGPIDDLPSGDESYLLDLVREGIVAARPAESPWLTRPADPSR